MSHSHKHLVIIGGGFAGMKLAKSLQNRLPHDWHLTLISQENFITFNPLLPEVVGASILPGHVIAPHRQMIEAHHVCMARVMHIDYDARLIYYTGDSTGVLHFDQLVLACGVNASVNLVPGMAEHALPLKTLGDALFLRNRIIARLEQAELEPDRDKRRWLTSFVVIGGGFTGVETAGELVDFLRASLRYYPNIRAEDLNVVLLHGQERLLPELSASLGDFACKQLRADGLDVRLMARAVKIDDRGVTLGDGMHIEAGTVICTIGTAPNSLIAQSSLPKERGRLRVNADMSVPQFEGVWALGDCAAVPNALDGKVSPPTAQFAERQATQLARNILAKLRGAPTQPFSFKALGQLATVGHNKAVAEMLGVKISGFIAWLLWRGVYLLKVPTFSRKTRLFLEWNWAMFFPPDIAHLGYRRTMSEDYGQRATGDCQTRTVSLAVARSP